jgi:predicted nucleic acid-binding protein
MNIYLDSCCYGRPFDDQTQPKIKAEADAIKGVIKACKSGGSGYRIVGSLAVISELDEIDDDDKREVIKGFYFDTIDGNIQTTWQSRARARKLKEEGLGNMDSQHLATAETAGADFLLTTDVDFIRKCKNKKLTVVTVMNPLDFKRRP